MLSYSDLYVTERLITHAINNDLDISLFGNLLTEYQSIEPEMMRYRLQSKTNVNFLMNYIDWETIAKEESADPIEFCDTWYSMMLYQEFDSTDKNSPKLEFTNLADSLRVLLKDNNVEVMCIYMDYKSDYIEKQISDFFMSSKIRIIIGNKEDFLKNHTFDTYFFEDIDDIEFIKRWHENRSELIVPTFPFNIEGYDISPNGEVIYSQDSLCKLPILDKNPIEYLSSYNIDIGMIDIPL